MIACGVHDPANPKFLMPITRRLFDAAASRKPRLTCAASVRRSSVPSASLGGSKTGV